MTDLLVLGGSGRTGAHVLDQAVERGHRVRALVRDPESVRAPDGAIVTWIARTYHRRRRQLSLGRLTPVEYETIMSPQAALRAA